MLELVNKSLQQRPIATQYIALLYAVYDPAHKQLTFSNSGLPYPIKVHANNETFLDLAGIPLGLFPDSTYQERILELETGDLIVFYTDGIVERRDSGGEEFGLKRLAQLIREHREKTPEGIIESIEHELERYSSNRPAQDDQTIFVMKMTDEEP